MTASEAPPSPSPPYDLAVVGGGVSGLSAAHAALQAGRSAVVLERAAAPGGSVHTVRRDGFLAEGGPHTLLLSDPRVSDWLDELGLLTQAVDANPAAAKRFILRGGVPTPLPYSAGSFFFGGWLSTAGKLRLLAEPLRHGRPPAEEESIGHWFRRHFGEEAAATILDPFVSGIYAGDPDQLSLSAAFPRIEEAASRHPSALRSFLRTAKERKKSGERRQKRRLVSFPEGLGQIPATLAERLGPAVRTGQDLQSIARAGEDWILTVNGEDLRARRLLLALPPEALVRLPLPADLHGELQALTTIVSPPLTGVALGFRREQVAHPLDGFGVLCPFQERRKILGILFDTTLFPGRAPEDQVLLSIFLGGRRQEDPTVLEEEALRARVLGEAREILGIEGEPTLFHPVHWPRAIPQYDRGYHRYRELFDRLEQRHPGLTFAGNTRDGVALGNCVLSGKDRAERILGIA
mgnify:CR=1 FL=1|jgi:oxygen-dependent protoporphyrinogen oxidase